jgi:rhodanese-related sulfurtransferase
MSTDAADGLVARGYTQVAVLDGGTEAWEASGRAIARVATRR